MGYAVRSFVILLGPVFVGSMGVLIATHWIVGALVFAFALLFAAYLIAVGPRWLKRPGVIVLGISLSAWLLILGVAAVVGLFWKHETYGTEWCGPTPLVAGVCHGRDFSFLQGRRGYSEAEGSADVKACRRLIEDTAGQEPLTERDVPDDKKLHAVVCPAWSDGPWTCFAQKDVSAGHDRYVTLYGFSEDCKRGRAWSLTNVGWAEMMTLRRDLGGR